MSTDTQEVIEVPAVELTPEVRILNLEAEVARLNDALRDLHIQTVNTVATQIQQLFTNEVLIDSIAGRILISGANALSFKAQQSMHRAGELVVLEAYIPGSIRTSLAEDGSISLEQQVKGSKSISEGWESSLADYAERGLDEKFKELLAGYGAEAGRVYYITDTVTQQKHRELLAKQLATQVNVADDELVEEAASVEA